MPDNDLEKLRRLGMMTAEVEAYREWNLHDYLHGHDDKDREWVPRDVADAALTSLAAALVEMKAWRDGWEGVCQRCPRSQAVAQLAAVTAERDEAISILIGLRGRQDWEWLKQIRERVRVRVKIAAEKETP